MKRSSRPGVRMVTINIVNGGVKAAGQAAKYTAKDSLFTDLFRDPKYLLQLYQALHPEGRS